MHDKLQPVRRRSRAGKTILRGLEYFSALAAIAFLACFVWVKAETLVVQTYQSWRLDQMQQGKPSTLRSLAEQWFPLPWEQDASELGQAKPAALDDVPPRSRSAARLPLHDGSLIGRLQIPRLGFSAMVMEGVTPRTLRLAVGHLPGTALPGEPGNVSLSGHRDTFFRELRKIQPGDSITMSTVGGDFHRYRVAAIRVVEPSDTRILDAYSGPGLNLVTCFPFYYVGPAPKRFIVHADEVDDSVVSKTPSPAPVTSLHQSIAGATGKMPVARSRS